eukprot:scaffold23178_cov54-Phaeocystis_antarctica.AAC.1
MSPTSQQYGKVRLPDKVCKCEVLLPPGAEPPPCVFRWELQPRDIPPLQRLANQRRSGGEVALVNQQHAEVVDGSERVRMPIAEGLWRCPSSASRYSGSVAARSPFASNSEPRW